MEINEETIQEILNFCEKKIPAAIDNPRYRSAVEIFLLASILEQLKRMSLTS